MRQISRTTFLATSLMLAAGAAFAQGSTATPANPGGTTAATTPRPATPAAPQHQAPRAEQRQGSRHGAACCWVPCR